LKLFADIEGGKALERALMNASDKLTRKVILSGMRKAATPIRKAMKAAVPVDDYDKFIYGKGGVVGKHMAGDLKKSIGNITGKSKKFATLYVGPRVKRGWREKGYIGHWVNFGNSTGYKVGFSGRRFVQKGYEAGKGKSAQILEGAIAKAALKFLK